MARGGAPSPGAQKFLLARRLVAVVVLCDVSWNERVQDAATKRRAHGCLGRGVFAIFDACFRFQPSGQPQETTQGVTVGKEETARRGSRAVSSSRRREHGDADVSTTAVEASSYQLSANAVRGWSLRATGASC